MLKIYTDHKYLKTENKPQYFPLLQEMLKDDSAVHQKYVFCNNIEECDILILPLFLDWLIGQKQKIVINFFKKKSLELNKPLWLFIGGDIPLPYTFINAVIFKQVDFKSTIKPNTFICPVFVDDPYQTIYSETIDFISKTPKPVIGYVGHAKAGFVKYLRTIYIFLKYNFDVLRKKQIADFGKFYPSSHIRIRYLKILQKSELLICKFIFRDRYRAGAVTVEDRKKTSLEFFDNIKNTQYTFCIRGGGNFSVRVYETLAMGRIPLQIDTDCVLPLEDYIDWSKHALFFSEKEISTVPEKLFQYHQNISEEAFIEVQKNNRLFWEKYLTKANYFNFIHDIVIKN